VVVIDPGHGGKDPGAVSQDGRLKEKDVALNIAERLRKILEKDEAVEVFLTRSDDRFMSLEDRAAAAASAKADLFISIHCNADLDSSSNGIETYYLSKACSRKSMKVAARENGIPLSNMNELEATIVNLEVSYRLAGSSRLAALVQKSVTDGTGKRFSSKRDRGVRRAAFSILAGAGASAVLVECGFLSNPSDQRKLETPAYLEQFAQALARAVRDYLSGNAQAK
jgi:N-acetylmuramoyl-L-alanine amidase